METYVTGKDQLITINTNSSNIGNTTGKEVTQKDHLISINTNSSNIDNIHGNIRNTKYM